MAGSQGATASSGLPKAFRRGEISRRCVHPRVLGVFARFSRVPDASRSKLSGLDGKVEIHTQNTSEYWGRLGDGRQVFVRTERGLGRGRWQTRNVVQASRRSLAPGTRMHPESQQWPMAAEWANAPRPGDWSITAT